MDSALKQRLIGAVVLVALAVIFLPMLIKGPAPDSGVSDVSLSVPAAPGGQYETRELPLVMPGQAPQGGAVGMGASPPAAMPAEPAAAGPEAADPAMQPPAAGAGEYAVNFGAYATSADADAVIARLLQAGLPGYREPAVVNGRDAYRVRIGPFADRAGAESVRIQAGRIRSDVKAQVVALDAPQATAATATSPRSASTAAAVPATPTVSTQPLSAEPAAAPAAAATRPTPTPATAPAPATPAPAAAPSPTPAATAAPSVGFAVQVGAFSRVADANALRDKLRAGGFSAFIEQVQTDKGALSRVRVGPVSSRGDAEQLKAQVAGKTGMSGLVVSHP